LPPLAALNKVLRIGDHGSEVAADGAAVVRHLVVFEVGRGRAVPVWAAGDAGAGPADAEADGAGLDAAGGDRCSGADHHPIAASNSGDVLAGGAGIIAVDIDMIAIAEPEAAKPTIEPRFLGRG